MRMPLLCCGALGVVVAASCKSSSEASPDAKNGPFGADLPVTEYVHLDNLGGAVDVVRDSHGAVHIYATSLADAVRVEAYQMARDRTVQLELFRRVAEGRTAELLGDVSPDLVDNDITTRTIGLFRAAKAMYAQYPEGSEPKAVLDAFADGVSQFNAHLQSGDERLPGQIIGIPKSAFTPWTGADVLAIGRLQSQNLAYTADIDLALQTLADAARAAFDPASRDPLLQKRSGFLVDYVRFAPLDPTTPLSGFPNDLDHTLGHVSPPRSALRDPSPAPRTTLRLPPGLAEGARGWSEATKRVAAFIGAPPVRGSNNWVVAPSRSATGHAMLASDPHLSLSAPNILYGVQLDVVDASGDSSKDMHAAGMAFPGIPGLVLGFNADIAWGATTADFDVTDVYRETLTADASAVVFNGANVPLEKIHETIAVAGGAPVEYDVLVAPHHGPLIPTIVDHKVMPLDPSKGALSIKWTGMQVTDELGAFTGFLRSKSVEDARVAIRKMGVGAENFVFADTKGNIFYSAQSLIPKRDKRAFTWDPKTFSGTLPCMVLPGDGTAEWTGQFLEEAYIPHLANPSKGYIATANGDQVGDLLDDDPSNAVLPNGEPMYMACWHDAGLRVGRITERIEGAGHPLTLDDFASIQGDVRSNIGARIAPKLVEAITRAEAEHAAPGTNAGLSSLVATPRYASAPIGEIKDALTRWGSETDYDALAGVSLDDGSPLSDPKEALASKATLVFNAWLVRMIELTLDDELNKIGLFNPGVEMRKSMTYLLTADPTTLATYDPATKDSALFDDLTTPDVVETRDNRIILALLDALDFLDSKLGKDHDKWRWGTLHTLRMRSMVPLWGALSIPPQGDAVFPNGFPRHGDGYNVDVAAYDDRPESLSATSFAYGEGPVQRFVIDLDPAGPVARNVIPGGEVWDAASKHFRDEAELWRRNQNHAVPYAKAQVLSDAESHVVFRAGASRDLTSP